MAKESSKMSEKAQVNRIDLPRRLEMTFIDCGECGAEVDGVENDDLNDSLVEKILSKSVPDRDPKTYVCRNGHDGELVVR